MKYSIVIVAYKAQESLNRCLASLAENPPPENEAELIIMDNSPERLDIPLKPLLPKYIRVIIVWDGKNRGFAEGCNEGVRHAHGKNIVLVNPDTIVYPGWAEGLAGHLRDGVGAVGPISNFVAGFQQVQVHMQPVEGDWSATADTARKVLAGRGVEAKLLIGFFMLVPRIVWDELGGMDPQFFLGCDDLDLSWRMKLAGYELIIASDVFVYHEGHASFYAAGIDSVVLNKQAEKKMLAKLAAHYGVIGWPVPTSTELWGCEILPTTVGKMQTLSICMIVRDEETNLRELLPQLGFADEIIIVDTGTQHGYEYGFLFREDYPLQERISFHRFHWTDDFSAARNYALSKCTGDWVLWLDADDRVNDASAKLIRALLDFPGPKTAAKTCYYSFLLRDHLPNGRVGYCDQPRLFPRIPEAPQWWQGRIHETFQESVDALKLTHGRAPEIIIDHHGYFDRDLAAKKQERNLRLLAMEPDGPGKFYQIAKSLALLGRHAEARDAHFRALGPWPAGKLAPDFVANTKYHIALLYYQEKGFACEEMDPWLEGNLKPDALFLKAERAFIQARIDDAEAMYKAYLELVSREDFMDFFGSERDTFGAASEARLDMLEHIRAEIEAKTAHA